MARDNRALKDLIEKNFIAAREAGLKVERTNSRCGLISATHETVLKSFCVTQECLKNQGQFRYRIQSDPPSQNANNKGTDDRQPAGGQ